jgi:hypothetical protein
MTWIKLRPTLPEDDRWLDAGPVAFTVHVASLCWSDQQLTDGAVSGPRVRRVANAFGIPPDQADKAAATLVQAGFWEETDEGYQIVDYLKDQLAKEDIENTRARWAADKRRQRQHRAGDHSLCEAARCPAVAAKDSKVGKPSAQVSGQDKPKVQRGQAKSPVRKGARSQPPRPDPTRPDPKGGEGRGGKDDVGSASGDAAPSGSQRSSASPSSASTTPFAVAPPRTPPRKCRHGVERGDDARRPSGMFTCPDCEAIAPHPGTREFDAWLEPVRVFVTTTEIVCKDAENEKYAWRLARPKFDAFTRRQPHTVMSPRETLTWRAIKAYVVEQIEPGRIREHAEGVIANGSMATP